MSLWKQAFLPSCEIMQYVVNSHAYFYHNESVCLCTLFIVFAMMPLSNIEALLNPSSYNTFYICLLNFDIGYGFSLPLSCAHTQTQPSLCSHIPNQGYNSSYVRFVVTNGCVQNKRTARC